MCHRVDGSECEAQAQTEGHTELRCCALVTSDHCSATVSYKIPIMSKLVALHLRHCKLTVTHADYIHRPLLGVLVENKHTHITSHTLEQLLYNTQKTTL